MRENYVNYATKVLTENIKWSRERSCELAEKIYQKIREKKIWRIKTEEWEKNQHEIQKIKKICG